MDGILNINKPPGSTSFSIVSRVKRWSGVRRVGHAGTLDPIASGVLPVCLGHGTRVIEFLMEATKTYQAQIELGTATDTHDATGKITQQGDYSSIDKEQPEAALAAFHGSILQTPPMYSALKHHGQRLYQLARAGVNVERKSRLTKINRVELKEWQPPIATIEVECGKGTYIRSLAHDLGQSLGCGANVKNLSRLRYGIFDIGASVSLTQLEQAFFHGYWRQFLYPADTVLQCWAAIVVNEEASQAIKNGQPWIPVKDNGSVEAGYTHSSTGSPYCRVYSASGNFLGVLRLNSERGQWQPVKVFRDRLWSSEHGT
jgi:tRNA pseudouridine55 synthase